MNHMTARDWGIFPHHLDLPASGLPFLLALIEHDLHLLRRPELLQSSPPLEWKLAVIRYNSHSCSSFTSASPSTRGATGFYTSHRRNTVFEQLW